MKLRALIFCSLLLGCSFIASASESDPWTFAYIPLADSGVLINDKLENMVRTVIDEVNSQQIASKQRLEDTALEFAFFSQFRSGYIRDVAWGVFERCIGTNNCQGWPEFERIQMYPEESVYHAVNWRYIPSRFHLASIVEVCDVRMGADKLTHFFDDGFHFFNAFRSIRKNLDWEDLYKLSMAFENSYMGTRLTGIVSRADIEANLAGVRFYRDFFGGLSPMIGRDTDGRLVMLRSPDICDYVSEQYDERVLPNEYSYSLTKTPRAVRKSLDLMAVINERGDRSTRLARELSKKDLALETKTILARRIPMTQWQKDFPKYRLVGHATGVLTQIMFDSDFRLALNIFGFNPLTPRKLRDRKPVEIQLAGSLDHN